MTTKIIATAPAAKVSQHVASVGDRVEVQGVIRKMFGSKPVLHVIHDIDGNEFTVKRNKALGSKPGVLVCLQANVVAHTEYQGVKRTELSSGTEMNVVDGHPFLARSNP